MAVELVQDATHFFDETYRGVEYYRELGLEDELGQAVDLSSYDLLTMEVETASGQRPDGAGFSASFDDANGGAVAGRLIVRISSSVLSLGWPDDSEWNELEWTLKGAGASERLIYNCTLTVLDTAFA